MTTTEPQLVAATSHAKRAGIRNRAALFVLPPREGTDEHHGLAFLTTVAMEAQGVSMIDGLAAKAIAELFETYVTYGPGRDRRGNKVAAAQQAVYLTRNKLFPRRGDGQYVGTRFTAEELAEANAWRRDRENRNPATGFPRDLDWFTMAISYFRQAIAFAEVTT